MPPEELVALPQPPERIPQPTLTRLSLYLRCLRELASQGVKTISSAKLEARCGIVSAQIRKDLSYFGEFGKPGFGYDVQHLLARLTEIMQLDREHRVIIIGAGNLGSALVGYAGFRQSPFRIVGIFDNNPNKIGRRLWDLEILDVDRLPEMNRALRADLGVITVPAPAAQEAAELLAASGVRGILNFAPALVKVCTSPEWFWELVEAPSGVALRNVDLTRELEVLCYHLDSA